MVIGHMKTGLLRVCVSIAALGGLLASDAPNASAQTQVKPKAATGQQRPQPKKPVMPQGPQITQSPESSGETIQADISSRIVSIEADFSGARLVLFGVVENSQQKSAESGIYDIVVVLEGPTEKVVVRRKSRNYGIWINNDQLTLQEVPSYYGIVSTRPLEDVAPDAVLDKHEIGFKHVYMEIAPGQAKNPAGAQFETYKDALLRLKQTEGLFREDQYGVAFIGRSLFRSTIYLPANVPVGTFRARVLLFRGGKFISQYTAPFNLERAGLERVIYTFADTRPFLYGVTAVLLALIAGLLATAVLTKRAGG